MKAKHLGYKKIYHLYTDCPKYPKSKPNIKTKDSVICRFCYVRRFKDGTN